MLNLIIVIRAMASIYRYKYNINIKRSLYPNRTVTIIDNTCVIMIICALNFQNQMDGKLHSCLECRINFWNVEILLYLA